MVTGVLDALKFRPHRIAPDSLERPALLARFEALADRDFLIVAAPAGFGKSTAVGSWAARLATPPAWVSLGEEDGSFQDIYPLIVRALASADPGHRVEYERLEGAAREAASAPEAPRLAAASLARAITSGVTSGRAGPIHLVLDDFHRCKAREACTFLLALSNLAAPHLKLLICGRSNPDFPLARLRAEGRLGELRARDLRFNQEETRRFVPSLRNESLETGKLENVEARLEGWPAGLRLLKLSLEDKPDPAAFLVRLGTSRRFVLDYLVEEVLSGLDPELTDFLFRTAMAEPFTPELAAILLDGKDSAARADTCLRRVSEENLFLVGLDETGTWFRYHHLFGELLRMRAPRVLGESMLALRRKAAAWFDTQGLPVQSCGQLLDGGFVAEAFDYLVRSSRDMYTSGRIPEILGLYERLPFDDFRNYPDAAVWYSWFLATMGRGARVPTLLAWAEEGASTLSEAGGETRVRAGIAMIRGLLALRAGEYHIAADFEAEALRLQEGGLPRDRAVVGYIRGMALAFLGDVEGATVAFLDSERLATVAGDVYTQFMAICERARVSTKGGRLDEAIALLSRAAALGTQAGGPPALWVGLAYVYEAQVLATLGRDAEALARVREGLALSIDRGSPPPIALGRRILFDLLMKAGDLEAAGRELEELHRFARATGMRAALDSYTEAETLLRKAEDGPITGSARAEARLGPKPQGWHTAIPGSLPAGEESQDAGPAGYTEPLSARELEVLSMIADGMTNQEIANALYLSLGTVKTHAHNIAVKLGSTNRTETVALARELELLIS